MKNMLMKKVLYAWVILCSISCQSQQKDLLEAKKFSDKITSSKEGIVLDVRTPEEYQEGFIEKAINIDYNDPEFQTKAEKLDKNKVYFIYCLSGGRSAAAASYMRDHGFKNVFELDGGFMAWKKQALPVSSNQPSVAGDKISAEEYEKIVNKMPIVLIDFYAPWCGPCRQVQPIVEALEKEYADKAYVLRINIDENKKLQQKLGIDEIPYFKRYINGKESGNFIGQLDKKSLKRILDGN